MKPSGFIAAALFFLFALIQLRIGADIHLFGDDIPYLLRARASLVGITDSFMVQSNGFWRPATEILFLAGNAVWGLMPLYALASVALKLVTCLVLFRFLTGNPFVPVSRESAWLGALVFMANFTIAEAAFSLPASGDWVLLLGILVGLGGPGGRRRDLVALLICLTAKEYGIIYLGIAVARDWFVARRPLADVVRELWPVAAVTAAYGVWMVWRLSRASGVDVGGEDTLGFGPQSVRLFMDQTAALLFYGPFYVNNHGAFAVDASAPVRWAIRLAGCGAVGGAFWWLFALERRRGLPHASVLIGVWFLASVGVVSLRSGFAISRYLVVPAGAVAVVVAMLAELIAREASPRLRAAAAITLLPVLALWLTVQCYDWVASPGTRYLRSVPAEVHRRMVALGDELARTRVGMYDALVLDGTLFGESAERRGPIMATYVTLLYPTLHLETYLADDFLPHGEALNPYARTWLAEWNQAGNRYDLRMIAEPREPVPPPGGP